MRCRKIIAAARAVENTLACPLGALRNSTYFFSELIDFKLNHLSISLAIRTVCRLNGKLAHPLHYSGNFNHGTLSGINHRLAIRRVSDRHPHTLNIRVNARCHRNPCSIISCRIYTKSGGKPFYRIVQIDCISFRTFRSQQVCCISCYI